MELRQLSHFLAVVDAGSLTLAADREGLTQQALSKSLARLELELGGKLFERAARGMVLSRLGDAIAEHARQVLADAGRLRHAASAELGLQRGANIVMPNLTPPEYRKLYEIYPAKACISETGRECHSCMKARIRGIGRTPGAGPGGRRRKQAR